MILKCLIRREVAKLIGGRWRFTAVYPKPSVKLIQKGINNIYDIQSVYESNCLLNLLTIIRTRWLISHFNPIIRTFYILN